MAAAPPILPRAERAITPELLAATAAEVERTRTAWQRHGSRPISADELTALQDRVATTAGELVAAQQPEPFPQRARVAVVSAAAGVMRACGLGPSEWWAAPFVLAFAGLPPGLLAAAVLFGSSPLALASGGVAGFLAAAVAAGVVLVPHRAVGPVAAAEALARRRAERGDRRLFLADQLAAAEEALSAARTVASAVEAHRAAVRRHEELTARLADRRHQLRRTNWKALRGVPFEQFLADVFRALGYEVGDTKASGDRGVDLIVTGGGRRVAVQTKGYVSSVGNDAVQQAHAGMTFYGCTESAVVTNSVFTPAARQLAERVGCRLIDETLIPGLIDGQVYPPVGG